MTYSVSKLFVGGNSLSKLLTPSVSIAIPVQI